MTDLETISSPLLLRVQHASKRYNGVPALIDAALELRRGEVHALMGENGAGKSTLIKLLAGIVSPDTMQLEVDGRPVHIHSPQDAFNAGLRFIHQELNIVPQLSIAENIFIGRPYPTLAGLLINWRALNKRAQAVLTQLGITHLRAGDQMALLSPGDQMLVSIARAFTGEQHGAAARPLIYVMDEPTAALSRQEVSLLFDVIRQLRERGSAVLYVSHRMDEIFQISDRITVMRDGRVVATSNTSQTNTNALIHDMTGRELQQVYPHRTEQFAPDVRLAVSRLRTRHVQEASFEVKKGEIVGVAGLTGAGRTELLRALMGVDRRRSGSVTLDGQLINRMTPNKAWAMGIAYVPEERRSQGLILSRSISDNITLAHLPRLSIGSAILNHGQNWRTSRELGQSVRLKATGPGQITRQLSGGNQQKVVFARTLVRPPRLLLLDEPTRGVDVGAKSDIYSLIREISAQGTSIVMVSSDLPELIGMCDRILIMQGRRLVQSVSSEGLTEGALLSLCYGEKAYESHATG